MSRKAQGLQQTETQGDRTMEGPGDIHALVASMREQMDLLLGAQFEEVERTVAKSMADRLASADALIARLSAENARLLEENQKHERTLSRLRELALMDK